MKLIEKEIEFQRKEKIELNKLIELELEGTIG